MRLLKDPASHPPVADAKARSDPVRLERGLEEPAASAQSEAKIKPVVPEKSGAFDPNRMPNGRLCLTATGGARSDSFEGRPDPSGCQVMLGSQDRKALIQQHEEQLRADAKKAVIKTTVSSEARSKHREAASSANDACDPACPGHAGSSGA